MAHLNHLIHGLLLLPSRVNYTLLLGFHDLSGLDQSLMDGAQFEVVFNILCHFQFSRF